MEEVKCVFSRRTIWGPPDLLPKGLQRYRAMTDQEYEDYSMKVEQTEGFDVDGCDGTLPGRIVPILPGSLEWKPAELVAKIAALSYSKDNQGASVVYGQLVKANLQPVSGTMYYLSFTGIDVKDDNTEKLYRAKVYAPIRGEPEVLSFEEIDTHARAVEMREKITPILAKIAKERSPSPEPKVRGHIKVHKIEKKQLHINGFQCLLKEIQLQNPGWKYGRVRRAASRKWRSCLPFEKVPYLLEAQNAFNLKVKSQWELPEKRKQ